MLHNVVDVVNRLWAGQLKDCGLIGIRNKRFNSFLEHLHKLWNSPKLLCTGYQGLYPLGRGGRKWLGHEVDHSPTFSAEIKNGWQNTYGHSYAIVVFKGTTLFFAKQDGTSQSHVSLFIMPEYLCCLLFMKHLTKYFVYEQY